MKWLTKILMRFAPAALVLVVAAPAFAGVPKPHIPKPLGKHCVQPTEVMRREHYEFLLRHRDLTMHEGIRTKKYDLRHCLQCHAPVKPTTAQARETTGHFCVNCHKYAGVQIDCFECHAKYPEKPILFHPIVTPGMKAMRDVHERPSAKLLNSLAEAQTKETGATQ